MRKTVLQPGPFVSYCTATEDGSMLEIPDLESRLEIPDLEIRGTYLLCQCSENKYVDQQRGQSQLFILLINLKMPTNPV